MGKFPLLILFLNLGNLLSSLACDCSKNPPAPPAPPPPSNCPPQPYSPPAKPPPSQKVKPTPSPVVKYPPPPPKQHACPVDALKLGACVSMLPPLVHIGIGSSSSAKEKCCPLLKGIADLDAAICLCTTIRVKLPIISELVLPVTLNVLVGCGKNLPADFQCPKY